MALRALNFWSQCYVVLRTSEYKSLLQVWLDSHSFLLQREPNTIGWGHESVEFRKRERINMVEVKMQWMTQTARTVKVRNLSHYPSCGWRGKVPSTLWPYCHHRGINRRPLQQLPLQSVFVVVNLALGIWIVLINSRHMCGAFIL